MDKIQKRCIVHIPNHLDLPAKSGSQIRPVKMKNAFEMNGYKVDYIRGYGAERKQEINKIKENINNGVKYDFVYSESSTMPTLLTEKNHLPRYYNLDFSFMKFCKKNGIPIGLFYRDIYWRFPVYTKEVKGIKAVIAKMFYKYDIKQYEKILDIFYVPNFRMNSYIPSELLKKISRELPPGCEVPEFASVDERIIADINLFYVGGVGNHYVFVDLLKGIMNLDFVKLVICCRENEWEKEKQFYEEYITENVTLIHKSGFEMQEYLEKADICCSYFKPDKYMNMAVPIKLFEYLSKGKPIIATFDTAAGTFVEKNKVGWSIEYGADHVRELLLELRDNKEEINSISKRCQKILLENTWQQRALQVEQELVGRN